MAGTSPAMTRRVCRSLPQLVSGAVNVSQCDLDSRRIERDAPIGDNTGQDVSAGLARMMQDRRQRRIDNQIMGDAWQPEIADELQRHIDTAGRWRQNLDDDNRIGDLKRLWR